MCQLKHYEFRTDDADLRYRKVEHEAEGYVWHNQRRIKKATKNKPAEWTPWRELPSFSNELREGWVERGILVEV